MGLHEAGKATSSAAKGADRENFITIFLSKVLPPQFRFGSGDITDLTGKMSGQVDIVVEYPFLPSIPVLGEGSRLYLAEGVAAVIEVKSNLKDQWSQVERTAEQLRPLRRGFGSSSLSAPPFIPIFAVGYTGWKTSEALEAKLATSVVDGILILESGLFVWNRNILGGYAGFTSSPILGAWSLWAFIVCLYQVAVAVHGANFDPALYALPDLVLLEKLYCASRNRSHVVVFDITDKEGMDRLTVKQLIESLQANGLLVYVEQQDELLVVSLTEQGERVGYKLLVMFQ